MAVQLDTHELAWAAGFFDGEGYIGSVGFNKGVRISVGQSCDLDTPNDCPSILRRFNEATGNFGTFRRLSNQKPHIHRNSFSYEVARFEHVQFICAALWRYLSPAKKAQMTACLGRLPQRRKYTRTVKWRA
jgi:hypothetical protein